MILFSDWPVLSAALSDGFSEKSLREMLRTRLNVNLDEVSPPGPLRHQVFDLIGWAESRGRLVELVREAYRFNPRNPALAEVYARMGMAPEVAVSPRPTAGPDAGPARVAATGEAIAQLVKERLGEFDLAYWREKVNRVQGQVCLVELRGECAGTGFLVGPDLVLTCYHVLEPVLARDVEPGAVRFRFDALVLGDGAREEGVTVPLADAAWDVDHCPPAPGELPGRAGTRVPTEEELDYALVRLSAPVGGQPLSSKATGGPERGWVRLPEKPAPLAPHTPLVLAQARRAAPFLLVLDTDPGLSPNENGTRVRYRTTTEAGCSGAPCFDLRWNVVAMHQLGDTRYAHLGGQGVPIGMICRRLARQGKSEALGGPRTAPRSPRPEEADALEPAATRPPPPGPVVDEEDTQKGRWGGKPERNGRALTARLTEVLRSLFFVDLIVRSTDGTPLQGPVVFHLHETYPKTAVWVRKILPDNTAVLKEVSAYEVFTAGAQVRDAQGQWVGLELDLTELEDLPSRFR